MDSVSNWIHLGRKTFVSKQVCHEKPPVDIIHPPGGSFLLRLDFTLSLNVNIGSLIASK
jgi:hypothetical protein